MDFNTTQAIVLFLIGFASSSITEAITWLNVHLLNGTLWQGNGARVVAALISVIVSLITVLLSGKFDVGNILITAGVVFTGSKVWYHVVLDKIGLTTKAV